MCGALEIRAILVRLMLIKRNGSFAIKRIKIKKFGNRALLLLAGQESRHILRDRESNGSSATCMSDRPLGEAERLFPSLPEITGITLGPHPASQVEHVLASVARDHSQTLRSRSVEQLPSVMRYNI